MQVGPGWLGAGATLAILCLSCARPPTREAAPDARGPVAPDRPDASPPADTGLASGGIPGELAGLHGLAGGPAAGPCGQIEAAWTKQVAAGGQCTRAADCVCYTSSLWAPFGQHATDAETAKALKPLSRQFSRRRCPTVCVEGTPVPCHPDCVDGRCVSVPAPAAAKRHR